MKIATLLLLLICSLSALAGDDCNPNFETAKSDEAGKYYYCSDASHRWIQTHGSQDEDWGDRTWTSTSIAPSNQLPAKHPKECAFGFSPIFSVDYKEKVETSSTFFKNLLSPEWKEPTDPIPHSMQVNYSCPYEHAIELFGESRVYLKKTLVRDKEKRIIIVDEKPIFSEEIKLVPNDSGKTNTTTSSTPGVEK